MPTSSLNRLLVTALSVSSLVLPLIGVATAGAQIGSPLTRVATGASLSDIQSAVVTFREDLGGGTVAGANGSFGGKRREINWDGVPDQLSAPNDMPDDFFNTRSPRGVVFSTPGVAFQVSAKAATQVSQRFGNLSAIYTKIFGAFSEERLFTPIGSTVTDVKFFVPGTQIPAVVSGFGAVFTDVDNSESTTIRYYDSAGTLITTLKVPATPGNASMSFAGLTLPGTAKVARVRITSGRAILTASGGSDSAQASRDKVAMDDFVYGEPVALS